MVDPERLRQTYDDPELSARVYEALVAGAAICTALVDANLNIIWVSQSVGDLLGYEWHELVGTSAPDLIHPDDFGPLLELINNELANPASYTERLDPARIALNRIRLRHRERGWVHLDMSANNETGNPKVRGFLLHLVPSEVDAAQDRVMEAIVERVDTAAVLDMLCEAVSAVFADVTVCARVEDSWSSGADHTPIRSYAETLEESQDNDGVFDDRSAWQSLILLEDRVVGSVTLLFDYRYPLTMWGKATLDRIARLGSHLVRRDQLLRNLASEAGLDPLTGLVNRRTFFRSSQGADTGEVGLIYIDLDGFKQINDQLGHGAGDAVLVEVGARIAAAVRPHDLVSRFGGDEFLVWTAVTDHHEAMAVADRILHRIADEPFVLGSEVIALRATIGVAVGNALELESLVQRADLAMLHKKQCGKGSVQLAARE
jgi:diguanylate cyclase (GGDEF)-like protein